MNTLWQDQQIASQLYGFLFAGHETTASALQWILYFMGESPEWVDQIRVRSDKKLLHIKKIKKIGRIRCHWSSNQFDDAQTSAQN